MANKANIKEVPPGKNKEKNSIPWVFTQTMLIPIKINKAIAKVTIRWLVKVKLYGTKPTKFKDKIKQKIVKTKGKNNWPLFEAMLSPIIDRIILNMPSIIICHLWGMIYNVESDSLTLK